MRFDPVAAFVHEHSRLTAMEARSFTEARVELGTEIASFLQGLGEGQVLRVDERRDFVLSGGAVEYASSQGTAFVWAESWFGDNAEGIEHLTSCLMISMTEPYENGKELFSFDDFDAPIDQPRAVTTQQDVNFCRALLRHMKKAYPKPKADLVEVE